MCVLTKKQNWSCGLFYGNVECTQFVKAGIPVNSKRGLKNPPPPFFLHNLMNIQQKEAFILPTPHVL